MAIEIHRTHDKLYATFSDELGKNLKVDLTPLLVLGEDTDRLLKPVINEIQLKRPQTIKSNLFKLHALGEGFAHLGIRNLPHSESVWQQLILNIHRFVMTRSDRKSSLQTRQSSEWREIRKFFTYLIDEGVAPVSLFIPSAREILSTIDISRYRDRLLGQSAPTVVTPAEKIDKLLLTISLARTDSEYLEEVRDTLAFRRRILLEALTDYWKRLKANMDFGRNLIASVDWPRLKSDLENIRRGSLLEKHPANPLSGAIGLANYLAVIKYKYDGCPPSDLTLKQMGKGTRYLPRYKHLGTISDWLVGLDAPPNFLDLDSRSGRGVLWWWQGRISHFDVSMLTALLIMLQPSWTPHAVLFARVTNKEGKQYLDFSDKGTCFEVKKPRALSMKEEVLDPLSFEIISTLIQENASLREQLEFAGDPRASLLLLPYGKSKVTQSHFNVASSFLSGSKVGLMKSAWIGSHYPELIQHGLGPGTITFSKIRKTEGVLEWFRTKSLKAVSRKLGNTERVVLHHYIPKVLLDAWNTRMIRRFQNLWISVAAANESFLLEVTDFACLEDLHAFLKNMLQLHEKTSSPLAETLHDRFSFFRIDESVHSPRLNGHLHVAISEGTLSALYSYQTKLIHLGLSDVVLDRKDAYTGLSPRHFLTLADLLQTSLPKDKNPKFRKFHESAMRAAARTDIRGKWLNFVKNG